MAARSDLASGTCSIHPLSPRTGGLCRRVGAAHFAGRVEEQCGNAHIVGHSSWRSARRKISSGTTIGIVHAHFVGRSKIDLTSISDPKMFGMCRIQSDQEICCICRVLFLPFCSLFFDMKPTMLLFCHIFCNMKPILLRICPSFCYMKPIVLPFYYLFINIMPILLQFWPFCCYMNPIVLASASSFRYILLGISSYGADSADDLLVHTA